MTQHSDRGFTLIELLIVVAIISIIAAIAVPGLLRSRMTGNETSAITSLRAINLAQVQYSTACGNGGYATSLTVLYAPPGGAGDGYISADLGLSATPIKAGYNFAMVPGANAGTAQTDCNGTATTTAYYATATPMNYGTTGGRSFATNGSLTVWELFAATPPTEPFGAPAAVIH
jgi:prepilin-type N-terminal cleavage/methylation domain-containing protein